MQSTRGVISTNVAMVECAGGQNKQGKDIFLLSELEKVWVTVSMLARKRLLDGRDVQIPHLGAVAAKETVLFTDPQHRMRYYTRKLSFYVNHSFAIRYSVNTSKVPIEKVNHNYSKITMAEIVDVCGVPARTAAMALKEFVLYIGEGIHQGKVFHIHFPGLASLTMKKELFTYLTTWEMQMDLFSIDSRRWSSELQVYGRETLRQEAQAFSVEVEADPSSRPVSRRSPESWRAPNTMDKNAKFVPAAPGGRLFSEIEREAKKKKHITKEKNELTKELEHIQESLNHRIRHYDCMDFGDSREGSGQSSRVVSRQSYERTQTPQEMGGRLTTRESIYKVLEEEKGSTQEEESTAMEVVELSEEDDLPEPPCAPADKTTSPGRFLQKKDTNLEQILREEEPFSRPVSRQGNLQQHSSVRDLIYGGTKETSDKENNTLSERPRYGRKRFEVEYDANTDHVKGLLKD